MNKLSRPVLVKRALATAFSASLLLISLNAQAGFVSAALVIENGATLNIENGARLDVNCMPISIRSGATLSLAAGGTIEGVGDPIVAESGGQFIDNGGTQIGCRPLLTMGYTPASISAGGVTRLSFVINNLSAVAASNITFSDSLNQQQVANPANATTDCVNGSLSAVSGGGDINLSGAQLAGLSSCSVSVDVSSSIVGSHLNISGDLSSSLGNSGTASAQLTVLSSVAGPVPTFNQSFFPDSIGPGSSSRLSFTIDNSASTVPVYQLTFSDTLPAGVSIATPANAHTDCLLGEHGVLSAPDGGSSLSLSGAGLGAGHICSVTLDVVSSIPGTHTNTTSDLISSAGNSDTSNDDLQVLLDIPGFSLNAMPMVVPLGGRSTLTYRIDNSLNTTAMNTLIFSHQLPDGLLLADPPNASTNCGSSILPPQLTAASGSAIVRLVASGSVPSFPALDAGASCVVEVEVVAISAGMFDLIVDELSYSLDGFSNPLSAGGANSHIQVMTGPIALMQRFVDDPVVPGGDAVVEYQMSNYSREHAATGFAFSQDFTVLQPNLPGLVVSSLLSNGCSGTITGIGTSNLSFSGGTLPPASVEAAAGCTIRASISISPGSIHGAYVASTSALIATVDGAVVTGNVAGDTLFVSNAPLLSMQFLEDPVGSGGSTVLEYTLTNVSSTSAATDIAFDNVYPVALATASVTPDNDACGVGSTFTYTPLIDPPADGVQPARLSLSNGQLSPAGMAGDSCSFSITLDVSVDTPAGPQTNISGPVSATVSGFSETGYRRASDVLEVVAAPRLRKSFTDTPVLPGNTVTLEYTLEHSEFALSDATQIVFTDDLEAALSGLIAIGLPQTDVCGAGSQLSGTGILDFSAGTLAPGESCTFSVSLQVPIATQLGGYNSSSSELSATVSGVSTSADPAEADLFVGGFSFGATFNPVSVIPGETVEFLLTLDNSAGTLDANSTSFTSDLSALLPGLPDVVVLSSLPLSVCGGNLSTIGSSFLVFSGGSVASGISCQIPLSLSIPATTANGDYINTTGNLTTIIDGSVVVLPAATSHLNVNSTQLALRKHFIDDPVSQGDMVSLQLQLQNLNADSAASDIEFSVDLKNALSGLIFSSVLLNDCGLTIVGQGTDNVAFSGGSLLADATCTLSLSLQVPPNVADGDYLSTSSLLSGTMNGLAVHGDAASDRLLIQSLSFSKQFAAGPVRAGDTTSLTYTLSNHRATAVTEIKFSEDLSAVVDGLISSGLPMSDVCGVGSQLSGNSSLLLSGAFLAAGQSCNFEVPLNVPQNAIPGTFPSSSSVLFVAGLAVAIPAQADLHIEPTPPVFAKSFMPPLIDLDAVSKLSFTIDNSASPADAAALSFTDNLPAGLVLATPANAEASCIGGSLTAVSGSAVISYSGGSLVATQICSLSVDVQGLVGGEYLNVSGDLTSSLGNSGPATAALNVDDDFDDDTIVNVLDNCPDDANTDQADLDLDGLGDVCDDDIDGDGMPNHYESANGLNPLSSFDQRGNKDGDAFNNLQEYQFNTDPNVFDADANNNQIPDVVELRRKLIVPTIVEPLLLSEPNL